MKTPVNKATVDTAKETKITNNHKSRKAKTLHNEKMGIIVLCEIFSQLLVCMH